MWPFKKQNDVIDLTYLAKRGLIKVPSEEVKDLTQSAKSADSDIGFFGSIASAAELESNPAADTGVKNKFGVKNKIEDFEFKLNVISKKIDNMLDRLDVVERRTKRE